MEVSKADLHIHTKYSFDGVAEPADVIDAAVQNDIRVVGITDHNRIDGALEAQELARGRDIEVVVGEEIYTGEGEIIGLFLKERITPREGLFETIQEIRRQDGLVIVPHPFNWTTLKETITVKKMRKIYEKVDAIEVVNPTFFGRRGRRKAPRLNQGYGLAELGNSDAHHHSQIGNAYTYFLGKTCDDLAASIIARETEAGFDNILSPYEFVQMVSQNIKKYGKRSYNRAKNINIRTFE